MEAIHGQRLKWTWIPTYKLASLVFSQSPLVNFFFPKLFFLDLESLSSCLYLFLSVFLDPSWNTTAGEPLTNCLLSSNKSIICFPWLSTSLQSAVTTCYFFLVRITKAPWAISLVTQKKGGTQRTNTTTHLGRSFTDQEHIPYLPSYLFIYCITRFRNLCGSRQRNGCDIQKEERCYNRKNYDVPRE